MQVLSVGVATLDIVDSLSEFPREDSEQRALARDSRLGGNAANTLVVLRQFGHHCSWAGTLADDAQASAITDALLTQGIDLRWARRHVGAASPVSHVLVSRRTASRTIVHYRDLPEFELADFQRIELAGYDWLHFEGRHVSACEAMLKRAQACRPDLPRSLEVEKPRPGIERLFPLAQVLICSRAYAQAIGCDEPVALFARLRELGADGLIYLAWGEAGAWLDQGLSAPAHQSAVRVSDAVDTLGAGDVFNAGVIHGLMSGQTPQQALEGAVALAGRKCARHGLLGLVEPGDA